MKSCNLKALLQFFITMVLLLLAQFAAAECLTKPSANGLLVAEETAIWKEREIPVCWEPEGDISSTSEGLLSTVRHAVGFNYALNSSLKFTGWGMCNDSSRGLRILVDNYAHPRVADFGCKLDGVKNGIILNFEFKGDYKCNASDVKFGCVVPIAVHEFGHALGFHHEQNRSDTDPLSACYQENYQGSVPNELMATKWDMDSIMNYCNPNWNGDGTREGAKQLLSKQDIEGLQKIYGKPRNTRNNDTTVKDNVVSTGSSVGTWQSGAIHCSGHNKRVPTCDINFSRFNNYGCLPTNSAPGNQCSFSKETAVALCSKHPQCFAVTCSPDRNDCQARSKAESQMIPLRSGVWGGFQHYILK